MSNEDIHMALEIDGIVLPKLVFDVVPGAKKMKKENKIIHKISV